MMFANLDMNLRRRPCRGREAVDTHQSGRKADGGANGAGKSEDAL